MSLELILTGFVLIYVTTVVGSVYWAGGLKKVVVPQKERRPF